MSTRQAGEGSALVVIDVQNVIVADAFERDRVVATIADLVDRARAADVPVVWVQHSSPTIVIDSPGWQIVPELVPMDGEPIVRKVYGDSFESSTLESELDARGVGALIVTGAQTDACVRNTIHGGFTRGYDVTLVSDAHTTEDLTEYGAPPPGDVIAHTNLYWTFTSGEGREARVAPAAEVEF